MFFYELHIDIVSEYFTNEFSVLILSVNIKRVQHTDIVSKYLIYECSVLTYSVHILLTSSTY